MAIEILFIHATWSTSAPGGGWLDYKAPVGVRTHGICPPKAIADFHNRAGYQAWLKRAFGLLPKGNMVGLFCYRSQSVKMPTWRDVKKWSPKWRLQNNRS